jgi:hypothetical protein
LATYLYQGRFLLEHFRNVPCMIADNGYIPERFDLTGLHVFNGQIEKLPGGLRAKSGSGPRSVIDPHAQPAAPRTG